MIGFLVTVLLFPLIGWTLGRRSLGESFLLGAGITGSVLFIAGVVHVPLVIAMVVIGVWGVGCGVWELKHRSRSAASIPTPDLIGGTGVGSGVWELKHRSRSALPHPTPHSPLPTILICIPLLALAFAAAITPLNDFDGRAFWALKAKGIAHE